MIGCHDFTCGEHGKRGEPFSASRHCRKCYGAARNPALAKSLGRAVLFAASPLVAAPAKPSAKTALPTYPCIHRGEPTGERALCGSCGGGVKLPVLGCAVKGRCVVAKPPKEPGIQCCRDCKERVEPTTARDIRLDPIAVAQYQRDADAFIASIPPYDSRFAGRGIVIAAGGKYWASAYVTCRMLRHVGCTLPIQIWYLGAGGERDERYEKLLSPHGVTFHDIDTHLARSSRRVVKGFGTKLFAVVNSAFEEVLSLDPDCYPCQDPTMLFSCPSYKRLGGIYWPDRDFTDYWTKWKIWGCAKRGPCGLETGVYVLHKRLAWEPMLLAEWYDDRPEMYYGSPTNQQDIHPGADYGDKGPHRAAWAKLRRDYAVFNPVATHRGFAYLQPGPDGATPMFVHRCHSKFVAEGKVRFHTTDQVGENMRGGLPGEEAAFAYLAELKASLGR